MNDREGNLNNVVLAAQPAVGLPTAKRFEMRLATPFIQKSLSENTKAAYRRVICEFFADAGDRHPTQISHPDVLAYRDGLLRRKQKAATVAFKLSVVRSLFEYLKAGGLVERNPASTKLVPPPELPEDSPGRALTVKEVYALLAGPNRATAEGARDYAMLVTMLRLSLRVSEVCALKASSIKWSHGRWVVKFKVKGGRERTLPVPKEIKEAIDHYLKLESRRRQLVASDGAEAYIFQPHTNYRTLIYDKPLTRVAVWKIVQHWGSGAG